MTRIQARTTYSGKCAGWLASPASGRMFHLLAQGIFLAAALLASWFYLERNTGDPGWRIFCVINQGNLCPSHQRWILVLVQVLPLLAVKAGLKLKAVLVLHALGPTLLFYLLYLYTSVRLKDRLAGMAIIWVSVLSLGPVYFQWSDLEMHLMGGMLITLYAMLFREGRRLPEYYVFIPLLILFIVTSHPMAMAPFAFLTGWYLVARRRADYLFFTATAVLLLLKFSGADRYEQIMTSNLFQVWTASGKTPGQVVRWLADLFLQNVFVWSMAAFAVYALCKRGKIPGAVVILLFLAAYLGVVVVLAPPEQHEPYLHPLLPVVVLLFLNQTRQILNGRNAGLALTVLVVAVSLFSIIQNRHWAVRKVAFQAHLIDLAAKSGAHFALVPDKEIPAGNRELLTGYYYPETMLQSALAGPDSVRAVIPASLIRQSIEELRGFLPDSLLVKHFPYGLDDFPDNVLTDYATTFFKEPYMEGMFKLYFAGNLNVRYFTPYPPEFQWTDMKNTALP